MGFHLWGPSLALSEECSALGAEELAQSEAVDYATSYLSWCFLLLSGWNPEPMGYFPTVCPPAELPGLGDEPGGGAMTSICSSDPLPVLTEWASVPSDSGDTALKTYLFVIYRGLPLCQALCYPYYPLLPRLIPPNLMK